MRCAVESIFADDFAAVSRRLQRWPALLAVWWPVRVLLLTLAYLGAVGAAFFVELLPPQLVAFRGPPGSETPYWKVAAVSLAVILVACVGAGPVFYRRLCSSAVIHVELIVLILGSVLALCYLSLTLVYGPDLDGW